MQINAEITTIHIPLFKNAVVLHLFEAFVFPLSNIVGIGIHRLDRITDHACKQVLQRKTQWQ